MANNANETVDTAPQFGNLPVPGPSVSSSGSSDLNMKGSDDELAGLPRLEYDVLHNKQKLFWVTFALALESSFAPVILYYGLSYGTDLRSGITFAIITSLFGIISGLEFALRSWRLILPADTYRPLGAKRWRFDFTHQTLICIYTILTALLIGGSIPDPVLVRPLAMPMALFFIHMGSQCLVMGWMDARKMVTRGRVSSIPQGGRVPPFVLPLVEDIVAVDGGGGKVFRRQLMARYTASRRFRAMIRGLNWFWGVGSLLCGIGLMIVVWILPEEIAYGVGWGVPSVFAAIWAIITIIWVRRSLRVEKSMWPTDPQRQVEKIPTNIELSEMETTADV